MTANQLAYLEYEQGRRKNDLSEASLDWEKEKYENEDYLRSLQALANIAKSAESGTKGIKNVLDMFDKVDELTALIDSIVPF